MKPSRASQAIPITFNGVEFPTLADFQREYPKFSSDDVVRAIRNGADTVLAVETYCWHRRNRGRRASIAAARSSQFAAKYALGS